MATNLVYAAYITASVVAALFGLFAVLFALRRERKQGGPDSTEFFLTARKSVGALWIGWSFYAAALGSWALFSVPSYAYLSGILGLAMYAISAGFPILLVAFFGGIIQRRVPDVMSLSDFVYRRFGLIVQLYVSTLMLLNMGIALTAEYTAVGDLFEYVVGSTRVPVVVINGVIAMVYTAYGGLYVSIVTDQAQAVVSIVLLAILVVFVAVTFRAPLPRPLPSYLGPSNYSGLASIAVMPISLASSTVYSEAMWQRCWASRTNRTLITGAIGGAIVTTCVVFLYGFGGFLAAWSGIFVPSGPDDYGNTILFSLLDGVRGGRIDWIIVVVTVAASTMSLAAVDSLQNAIVDNISGVFLRRYTVWWSRALVVVLNVPPIIVSLQSYNIISLFLIANLVTTTSTLPLLAGLLRGYWARRLVTSFSMLSGCGLGMASLFVWAKCSQKATEATYNAALHRVFFEVYDYPPFLLALGFSVVGLLLGAALENALGALTGRQWAHQEPSLARGDGVVLYSTGDRHAGAARFEEADEKVPVPVDDPKALQMASAPTLPHHQGAW